MYLSMNDGIPSPWAALTIDWWDTESNALLMSLKVWFSLCLCSLYLFLIALIINNNNSSFLWRCMHRRRLGSSFNAILNRWVFKWLLKSSSVGWDRMMGEGCSRWQARHGWNLDWRWIIYGLVGEDELRRMNEGGWEYGGGEWDGWDREGWIWLEYDRWLKRFWRWWEGV